MVRPRDADRRVPRAWATELLRADRGGYYDSGDSLCLPAREGYLYVDRPLHKSLSRSMRSLLTGRRAQVLHGLLVHHQDWVGVKDLAEQALISPAMTSHVLTGMECFDWAESRGQGPSKQRHLRELAALLDAWAKQLSSIRPPALRRYFVPAMKPDGLMKRLGRVCEAHGVDYVVNSRPPRCAPFLLAVSQVRCPPVAGPGGGDVAIVGLGARVTSEAANLAVIEARSAGDLLFRERSAESGWTVRSKCTSTSSAAKVEPRRWPNTRAEKGSASDGQARNFRRLQGPANARLRAGVGDAAAGSVSWKDSAYLAAASHRGIWSPHDHRSYLRPPARWTPTS